MDIKFVVVTVGCFLLLISPFRYIINYFSNEENEGSNKFVLLFTLLLLCLSGLWVIETLTISPGQLSGKENLAMYAIIPLLMILAMYVTALFLFSKQLFQYIPKWRIPLTLVFLGVAIYSLMKLGIRSNELFMALGGTPDDKGSIIFQYPWLNAYTNTLFFNVYSFIFITATTLVCTIPFAKK